ncbi:hypothetical protein Cpin_4059 [Chitinophaga pinensis DSM 2588]|uniref:Uncharacterized protein n=1 Tax=Chitinophaga pinensis (strain ATCC 43595 / DSM 2588 / LMG 13176 / NBRC 15968 / NCIMB 11800 / UQM 2034) TaxID=485918 RepID=A0A979GVR1_CHIPD|nr:hypothetical protein Cpin_4059 [Chitinophaga pinensis DSM 2588]
MLQRAGSSEVLNAAYTAADRAIANMQIIINLALNISKYLIVNNRIADRLQIVNDSRSITGEQYMKLRQLAVIELRLYVCRYFRSE